MRTTSSLHLAPIICAVIITGCCKDGISSPETRKMCPLVLNAMTETTATRGIVDGSVLDDSSSTRILSLSARMHPQDGSDDEDYFTGVEFIKDSTGEWVSDPVRYWPLGSTLDLMSYSSSVAPESVEWRTSDCSSGFRAVLTEDNLHDDFLYASASGVTCDGNAVPLTFRHSQAWIGIHISTVNASPTTLDSMIVCNSYTGGTLVVTRDWGSAEAAWDFRSNAAADYLVDDGGEYYGKVLDTAEETYMEVLLPEQPMTSLRLCYTVDSAACSSTVSLSGRYWQAGNKYDYYFTIDTY